MNRLNPEAIVEKLKGMEDDVKSLRRAFYTFAIGAVSASIIFAFSVFALLGKHP